MNQNEIVKATCPFCNQEYNMGYNGTVDGCDKCLEYTRDRNGYPWHKNEKVAHYINFSTGKLAVMTRQEAFGEKNESKCN